MDTITRSDLQQLTESNREWHVSIYMPINPIGQERQQDPIRLKNLLSQAEKSLFEHDLRRPDVQELLRPAEELLLDPQFWQSPGNGLAVLLSNDLRRIYRLSGSVDEQVTVGKRFSIHPLVPFLVDGSNFYIVTLSQNMPRLFLASRDNITAVELTDTPANMEESLRIEDKQKNLDFHTMTSSSAGGERAAMYYGQGVEDENKDEIRRYLQQLDKGIMRAVEDATIPMVVAGVEYLLPIFRETTSYRNVMQDGITGSPDRQDLTELHAEAWRIVEPVFRANQQKAIDRFLEFLGQQNGLAVNDLDSAVKAAIGGRIETLIVPLGVQKWGQYDPTSDSVRFDSESTADNEDMIDFAATKTILNSGNVYSVPADQLPGGGDVAAILRYAI